MNLLLKPAAVFFSAYAMLNLQGFEKEKVPVTPSQNIKTNQPKIQAAILLDVSNSMDGLIQQAKAQLWNMVNVMGKVKCDGSTPQIEIALYEYGRSSNDPKVGYVKQVSPFTSDLDNLSQELFGLTTNGGDEYCGQVIHTSLNTLTWDTSTASYKVIFIAGNEDFLQGNVSYTLACAEAKKKGVIVNTIYCGDRMQGIREHWNLLGECGNGSFTNINADARPDDIPTPYDSALITLNRKLNSTYIYYGTVGEQRKTQQRMEDNKNMAVNGYVASNRIAAKANAGLYYNGSWDLVDATKGDAKIIDKVDLKTLPDSLQGKKKDEIVKIVKAKTEERDLIQNEILSVNADREKFIKEERKRRVAANIKSATLETEVEKIIVEQASRFNMKIE